MADNNWINERIQDLEVRYLQDIFECKTPQAVEAASTYARFLASCGVSPENCGVFLRLLEIENRWVIDALVGKADPFSMLSAVQPSQVLVEHLFRTLNRWHRGGIHAKNLSAVLGVLRSVYASPRDGYKLYPLGLGEVNALGKHLEKKMGQDDPVNRALLDCLGKLAGLEDPDDDAMDAVAVQATAIRNAFFDDRRQMADVIPEKTLDAGDVIEEVKPRKAKRFQAEKAGAKA